MRHLLLLILALFTSSLKGQSIPFARPRVDTTFEQLSQRHLDLQIEIQKVERESEKQFDRLSGQITLSGWVLAAFTLLLTVLSIGAGFYISSILKSINTAKLDIAYLVHQTEQFKEEMSELSDSIKNETVKAYNTFKRIEVNEVINHLQNYPQDITLFDELFAITPLSSNDYTRLKSLVISREWNAPGNLQILTLILRRFPLNLIESDDLDELIKIYEYQIRNKIGVDAIKRLIMEVIRSFAYREQPSPREAKVISILVKLSDLSSDEGFFDQICHPYNSIVNAYNLATNMDKSTFRNNFLTHLFRKHAIDLDNQPNADQVKSEIFFMNK